LQQTGYIQIDGPSLQSDVTTHHRFPAYLTFFIVFKSDASILGSIKPRTNDKEHIRSTHDEMRCHIQVSRRQQTQTYDAKDGLISNVTMVCLKELTLEPLTTTIDRNRSVTDLRLGRAEVEPSKAK
jgi:hypothetical protein